MEDREQIIANLHKRFADLQTTRWTREIVHRKRGRRLVDVDPDYYEDLMDKTLNVIEEAGRMYPVLKMFSDPFVKQIRKDGISNPSNFEAGVTMWSEGFHKMVGKEFGLAPAQMSFQDTVDILSGTPEEHYGLLGEMVPDSILEACK